MSSPNGGNERPHGPLELSDVLSIETNEGSLLAFEVVCILEDPKDGASYAVLRHEAADEEGDEFIVTDLEGKLLEEDRLAQEILDDFLAFAEDEEDTRSAHNGETS
jgi:hypothetical protein